MVLVVIGFGGFDGFGGNLVVLMVLVVIIGFGGFDGFGGNLVVLMVLVVLVVLMVLVFCI